MNNNNEVIKNARENFLNNMGDLVEQLGEDLINFKDDININSELHINCLKILIKANREIYDLLGGK